MYAWVFFPRRRRLQIIVVVGVPILRSNCRFFDDEANDDGGDGDEGVGGGGGDEFQGVTRKSLAAAAAEARVEKQTDHVVNRAKFAVAGRISNDRNLSSSPLRNKRQELSCILG